MTVYVDDMDAPFGRMKMSHMFSDTSLEELHAMATKLGIRRWFQDDGGKYNLPHYDVSISKRAEALALGAKMVRYGCDRWMDLVDQAMRSVGRVPYHQETRERVRKRKGKS